MIDLIRFRSLDLASDTWSFSFSLLTWFSYNFFLTTTTFDSNFSYILVVQETSVSERKTMFISKLVFLTCCVPGSRCSENNEFYTKIKSPNRPKWILSNFISVKQYWLWPLSRLIHIPNRKSKPEVFKFQWSDTF